MQTETGTDRKVENGKLKIDRDDELRNDRLRDPDGNIRQRLRYSPKYHCQNISTFLHYQTYRAGTGRGLSITYGIVKAHGSQLKVSSIEFRGSAFTIRLPIITI